LTANFNQSGELRLPTLLERILEMDNVQTVKELRDIAAAMASGDRSNKSLGAVYDSIMELSYKLQDEAGK